MAEGRIQYCIHHTPELLRQERWVSHPNGAQALASVIIVVGDLDEAVLRYERFLGRKAERRPDQTAVFRLDRGTAMLGGPDTPRTGNAPLPFVAAYGIKVRDLKETERFLDQRGVVADKSVPGVISVDGGTVLNETIVFHA